MRFAAACQDLVAGSIGAQHRKITPGHARVEHLVDGNRQLDHAQDGAQMATGTRHSVNHSARNSVAKLARHSCHRVLKVGWERTVFQKRSYWWVLSVHCLTVSEGVARKLEKRVNPKPRGENSTWAQMPQAYLPGNGWR